VESNTTEKNFPQNQHLLTFQKGCFFLPVEIKIIEGFLLFLERQLEIIRMKLHGWVSNFHFWTANPPR